MAHAETLIHARWIVPVIPEKTVLENHSLVLNNGRIEAILPTSEATGQFDADEVITLNKHAIIPGLVNAHTHSAMSLMRGLADDLPLMDWLNDHIWPAEAAHVGEQFCADGVRLAAAEMLRGGTTCFNDMYFFPDVTARTAADIGMRAAVGMILIDFPTVYAQTADEYLEKGQAMRDEFRGHPLIQTSFAPHAPYTVSDEPLKKIVTRNGEMELRINIHLHETALEVDDAVKKTGQRPLARLEALGLLTPDLIAVHMTQLSNDEIDKLAAANAHVVHCPESNMKLASGFCPVDKLLKAGVNVALGTDGAASNNDVDMLGEMRTAALLAKAVAEDASALPAHQALHMATFAGAKALGLDEQTGSIETGKWADLCAIELDSIETQPMYNVISQIVYAAGRRHVTDTWVAGRRLLRSGKLTTISETDVLGKAAQWREKLNAQAEH